MPKNSEKHQISVFLVGVIGRDCAWLGVIGRDWGVIPTQIAPRKALRGGAWFPRDSRVIPAWFPVIGPMQWGSISNLWEPPQAGYFLWVMVLVHWPASNLTFWNIEFHLILVHGNFIPEDICFQPRIFEFFLDFNCRTPEWQSPAAWKFLGQHSYAVVWWGGKGSRGLQDAQLLIGHFVWCITYSTEAKKGQLTKDDVLKEVQKITGGGSLRWIFAQLYIKCIYILLLSNHMILTGLSIYIYSLFI